MDHKVKSLKKIFNKLVKDRLNKIFEKENIKLKILSIDVRYETNKNEVDSLLYRNYKELYVVSITMNEKISFGFAPLISHLFLNSADYILNNTYAIKLNFFDDIGFLRDYNAYNNFGRLTDDYIINELIEYISSL